MLQLIQVERGPGTYTNLTVNYASSLPRSAEWRPRELPPSGNQREEAPREKSLLEAPVTCFVNLIGPVFPFLTAFLFPSPQAQKIALVSP